jgi:hypothetical protein
MLCHAVNNSLALLASAAIDGAAAASEAEVAGGRAEYALAALALFAVGLGLLGFVLRKHRPPAAPSLTASEPETPREGDRPGSLLP